LCGISYTSASPSVSGGATPLTWSLLSGPAGMTINSPTGAVTWPSPDPSASPYTITVQASSAGSCGTDSKKWSLPVNVNSPLISAVPGASALCGISYTSAAPSVSGGASPYTWSLLTGPAGMTINASTGAVSWPSPDPSGSPYTITVQVSSSGGCGT